PPQMSANWIANRVEKMAQSAESEVRETARLIQETQARHPERISRELWHHDLERGITRLNAVDESGSVGRELARFEDRMIANHIETACHNLTLVCAAP
ncbi:MAG: hypothetical protein WCP34_16805, partial [Pseudomonadota bacterium]